ncbi:hypothetical protein IW139_003486 [Coemansia sp. RSA 353]|nr:hypothetical protein GGH17_001147 [Coemansia sp. RSA 788]KAJ2204354.1 hypothetical protein IW145_003493 [Coemansia sp. RSA 521]KAJ2296171.1 hypothetical protein IW139_003486 [Coemansia sp. RSA 353]
MTVSEPRQSAAADPVVIGRDKDSPTVDYSQTKISGSMAYTGGFGHTTRHSGAAVDRTLVCKAFMDTEAKVVRVCSPDGFGKCFATSIIKKFFSVVTRHDMPRESISGYNSNEIPSTLDPEVARAGRAKIFESTVLRQELPVFFDEHFCRHPVLLIDFRYMHNVNFVLMCRGMTYSLMKLASFWTEAYTQDQLDSAQKEALASMTELRTELNENLYNPQFDFDNCGDNLRALFALVSDFVFSVSKQRYIVIVRGYDRPLCVSAGKPFEDKARKIYMALLSQIFKNNDRLFKGILTGVYAFPLDDAVDLGLNRMSTIMPTVNGCYENCSTSMLANPGPFNDLLGITRSEVVELASLLRLTKHVDFLPNRFGGYSFGRDKIRYNIGMVFSHLVQLARYYEEENHALYKKLFKPDNMISKFVLYRRAEMLLFVSRLTCDYDNGGSSCFVWPSSELKTKHCKSADDELCNFVLDAMVHPGKINAESDMDSFVSLLLCLGYVSIGANNALCIPNNNIRDMWETVRVAATFGTPDQLQQDIAQRQLTDSLFDGIIRVLCSDFQFALTQLATNNSYEESTLLEFACRYIASKLTLARYTVASRPSNVDYDHQFLADPQFNRTWKVTLLPFGRYIQTLVVYFHFVPITPSDMDKSGINSVRLIGLANQALDKINSEYPSVQNSVRLDLGIAFGCGNVIIQKRVHKQSPV